MCAEEVVTEQPMPGFDQAAIDGYAVQQRGHHRSRGRRDRASGSPSDRGRFTHSHPSAAQAGRAIETGAPMPTLADAVLPLRWSDGGRPGPRASRGSTWCVCRHVGDDVQPVTLAVRAGAIIGPAQVGAAGRRGS